MTHRFSNFYGDLPDLDIRRDYDSPEFRRVALYVLENESRIIDLYLPADAFVTDERDAREYVNEVLHTHTF